MDDVRRRRAELSVVGRSWVRVSSNLMEPPATQQQRVGGEGQRRSGVVAGREVLVPTPELGELKGTV